MAKKCKKGYKLQEGKCIKKKVFLVSSKSGKSYNPFKMWGSWVGAVILYLSTLIFGIEYYNLYYLTLWQTILHLPAVNYSVIISSFILGFFLGWMVQILIRRLRK